MFSLRVGKVGAAPIGSKLSFVTLAVATALSTLACQGTDSITEEVELENRRHGHGDFHGSRHGHHDHDGPCRRVTFEGHDYLFCPRDRNWENARKRCQHAGMDLASIDSAAENAFILSKIREDSFIGASDSASEGHWTWSGTGSEFWTGGPNGSSVGGAYENWGRGEPRSFFGRSGDHHSRNHHGSRKDCGLIQDHHGKWEAVECHKHNGFVCEKTDDCLDTDKLTPGQCGCAVPDTDTDGDGTADCVDACPFHPEKILPGVCGCADPDIDTDGDTFLDCQDSCPEDPTNECRGDTTPEQPPPPPPPSDPGDPITDCNPSSALPAPVEPPIDTLAKQIQMAAALAVMSTQPLQFGRACEFTTPQDKDLCGLDPDTITATRCGVNADGTLQHNLCTGLGAGFVCGYGKPAHCTPDSVLPECEQEALFCGRQDAECMADPPVPGSCTNTTDQCCAPDGSNCPCTEFPICGDEFSTGNPGPHFDYITLPQAPNNDITDAGAANPAQPPTGTYFDPEFAGNCGIDPCWCHWRMDFPGPLNIKASEPRTHGTLSSLFLSYTPESSFTANVFPRAFGEVTYNVSAENNWRKHVLAAFQGEEGEKEAISVRPVVNTTTCTLNTGSTALMVMEKDFIHRSTVEPIVVLPDGSGTPAEVASANCEEQVATYLRQADRSKKALRDVQILMRDREALPDGQTWDKESFCGGAGPDSTSDPGFEDWDCANVPISTSINEYIDYYHLMVTRFQETQDALLNSRNALDLALDQLAFGPTLAMSNGGNFSAPLLTFQFFVGPVPVTISLKVVLSYQAFYTIEFRLNPFKVLALPLTGDTRPKAQIFTAGGALGVSGHARVEAFAGLGFDEFFGFSVSAGVRGRLSLVNPLTVNLRAGAGITVESLGDERPTPADMIQDLGAALTDDYIVPARQTTIYMDWFLKGDIAMLNVLSGDIGVRARLAAPLVGSRVFRKTLISFDGFDLTDPDHPFVLFDWGGSTQGADQTEPGSITNSLGTYEMQAPLPRLRHIAETPDVGTPVPFALRNPGTRLHFDETCPGEPP